MTSVREARPVHRQKLNAYNLFVLLMLGLGSISYGYNGERSCWVSRAFGVTLTTAALQRRLLEPHWVGLCSSKVRRRNSG